VLQKNQRLERSFERFCRMLLVDED